MTIWCNGNFVESLTLDSAERGLMLGDGIFETVAVRGGKAIWLKEHLVRMASAAQELGLPIDEQKLQNALRNVLGKSASGFEVLRINLTRGPTSRGFAAPATSPSLIITLNPLDLAKLPASVRLATSKIRRNESAPSSRLKTLSYIDAIAAAREVAAQADDASMLNTSGHVASTTIANIFVLSGNVLATPALNQGILPGITRAKLVEGVNALGLQVQERTIDSAELTTCDVVFLTNSLRLATPVATVDGKVCGTRNIAFIQDYLARCP